MITKTDITNKFNEIFDSTKSYDKLSEVEKLYALLALNNSSGSGTSNSSLSSIDTKLTSGINSIVTNLVPTVGISGSKNITTAATFEVLTTSNTLASGIYVQAKTTNTGLVTVRYLGTTDGVVIEKGQSLFFAINNSNKLEVTVSVNGEGLRWWGS